VDSIYRVVGTSCNPIEQDAYARYQFDATLDLLERRLPGRRLAVRAALARVLQPRLRRKGATDTHAALLQLARNREGSFRLVTTNFDRIFDCVTKRTKQSINAYAAPMLPIPKNSRWNGLVYLHGLMPEREDESELNRLVLTSGDFGLAYLTERWAARFVSELFRNYVVCFVGYSITRKDDEDYVPISKGSDEGSKGSDFNFEFDAQYLLNQKSTRKRFNKCP